ncbi:hypothetical protein HanHA300_Chr08g0268171 [Helianthus annuus]|nr:hypothetical protein HanHA300_Chr08g0268171 [Helianthus annuus]
MRKPVNTMSIILSNAIIMNRTRSNRLVPDRNMRPGRVNLIRRIIPSCLCDILTIQTTYPTGPSSGWTLLTFRKRAQPRTKIRSLVHVDPQPIDRNELMKPPDFISPPRNRGGVKEIRKVNCPRPHLSQIRLPLVFNKHVFSETSLVGPVRRVDTDPGVDNDNVLHATGVYSL